MPKSLGSIIFVGLQVLIPLWAWRADSPYLAWNMFSYTRHAPRIVVVRPAATDTVPVSRYLALVRSDFSYGPSVGPQICQRELQARSVHVLFADGRRQATRCR
jgi:hypothetical protein